MEVVLIVLLVLLAGAVYFLPTIVALSREHHQAGAIVLLNLFAGWTVIAWIAALIGSATAVNESLQPKKPKAAAAGLGSDEKQELEAFRTAQRGETEPGPPDIPGVKRDERGRIVID